MLQKPRTSGKKKKNDKRNSAPPSQLGPQTMMLKQPQTGGAQNNNNGDLLDLFSGFAPNNNGAANNNNTNNNNNSNNNNNNGGSNPFDLDFLGGRPGLSASKSHPNPNQNDNPFNAMSTNNNTNNNASQGNQSGSSAFDSFGNDDFFGSSNNSMNSNPFDSNAKADAAISPRLKKQLSHPVGNGAYSMTGAVNILNNANNNNANKKRNNHFYQDSHAQLDPFMDLSMFDEPAKNKNDQAGGLLMIVDESTMAKTDNNIPKTTNNKDVDVPSKANNNNNNNTDSGTDTNTNTDKKKHKHKKKRKSGVKKDDTDKANSNNDGGNNKDKHEDDKKLETNALEELHRGSALLKYPRRSGFPHFKHIQLSKDNTRIQWYSKRKALDETCILIKDIREVVKGQKTETFKKFQQRTLEKSSFSIVYGMDYKSLDVAAKSIDECQMWVKAITELYKISRNGGSLTTLKELYVGINFKDRNRPRSRQGSGNFIRANNSKTLKIDPESLKEIEKDMETLHKNFEKVSQLTQKSVIQKSDEYQNILTVLSEIEERMEELTQEVANIRDTELAKREVWRANVDLNAMLEKVEVLSKLLDRRKSNLF